MTEVASKADVDSQVRAVIDATMRLRLTRPSQHLRSSATDVCCAGTQAAHR